MLYWSTASEYDADRFEILRDNAVVAMIEATNSATGADYTWTDTNVLNGILYNYRLIDVDNNGYREDLGSIEVSAEGGAVVTEYALHQNYPNPAVGVTNIVFDLVDPNTVQLTLWQRDGNDTTTLAQGVWSAGRHWIEFDATNLSNGLYDYRLVVADFDTTQTMLHNAPAGQATPNSITSADGGYSIDIAVGNTIQVVDGSGNALGNAVLRDVQVMASKQGYLSAEDSVTLQNQELRTLDFTLTE
ncbi:MAG: hypothetical protein IPG71_04045 [bacterium]|nr:hypothetical protein [bacterium]